MLAHTPCKVWSVNRCTCRMILLRFLTHQRLSFVLEEQWHFHDQKTQLTDRNFIQLNWSLERKKKKYTQDMSVRVFSLLMSLPLIFPLEETSSCWAAQRHTCHCFSDTHAHTFCNLLTHTNIHRNVQSLIPWSLICAPVSGREVEWQYGIPGGTERCGDRHPNPSPSRPPKHRKTRPKRK